MKWNLRFAAANRGVWKANELQRKLAEHGLVISAGKMSGLWSGTPTSVKLDDLDVICEVLGCDVGELLIPQSRQAGSGARQAGSGSATRQAGAGTAPSPIGDDGSSLRA